MNVSQVSLSGGVNTRLTKWNFHLRWHGFFHLCHRQWYRLMAQIRKHPHINRRIRNTWILLHDAILLDIESFARIIGPPFFELPFLIIKSTSRVKSMLHEFMNQYIDGDEWEKHPHGQLVCSNMPERSIRKIGRPNGYRLAYSLVWYVHTHQSWEKKGGLRIPAGNTIYWSQNLNWADNVFSLRQTSLDGGLKYAFTVDGNISQELRSRVFPSCCHFL